MRRRPRFSIVASSVAAVCIAAGCGRAQSRRSLPSSIVLITVDTLRSDYVRPDIAPAMAAFGREALIYDQAITAAPLTLPAHTSLLTGLDPPRHGVRDNEIYALSASVPTYPSLLKARGYRTAAFVSAPVLNRRYGLDRGFDVYDDEISGPERDGTTTVAHAERWIDAAPQPFFAWVHLFEPHAPYRTGAYASEVSAADRAIDSLFKHLRSAQLWDDLVVSLTSDHGESLGEHGEDTHGFFLYEATLHIPWMLKAPHVTPGRVGRLARIVDELPTVLDVAGVHLEAPQSDGIDLAPAARNNPPAQAYSETFLPRDQFGWSELLSLRSERLKYIDAPQPELYDLARDPVERTNVVSVQPADARSLSHSLHAMAHASAPPGTAATPPSAIVAEQLMSLGYLGVSRPSRRGDLADPKSKLEVYKLTMRALELSEHDDADAALETVTRAEALDPKVAQVEFLKGSLLGRMGRFDEAVAALERTLALDPQHAPARYKLALAWLRLGRHDRAGEALHELLRQHPDDYRAWHNLAAIAYSGGDLDRADELERKALQISPTYAEAWNTLGAIALVRKQPGPAVDAFTKATTYAPQNAQAFRNLGLALRAAGSATAAERATARACELDRRLCAADSR
jgi:choline-sulfatase